MACAVGCSLGGRAEPRRGDPHPLDPPHQMSHAWSTAQAETWGARGGGGGGGIFNIYSMI